VARRCKGCDHPSQVSDEEHDKRRDEEKAEHPFEVLVGNLKEVDVPEHEDEEDKGPRAPGNGRQQLQPPLLVARRTFRRPLNSRAYSRSCSSRSLLFQLNSSPRIEALLYSLVEGIFVFVAVVSYAYS